MKKLLMLLLIASVSSVTQAASVSVDFVKTDQYKDIDSGGNQSQNRFEGKLFSIIEKSFSENAAALPGDMSLDISVLDIDLAGAVAHGLGFGADIRQVTDKDFPRLLFYMVLKDKNGEIVFQGRQNLRERKLRHTAFRMKGSQTDFYMETALIDKWFESVLTPAVAKR